MRLSIYIYIYIQEFFLCCVLRLPKFARLWNVWSGVITYIVTLQAYKVFESAITDRDVNRFYTMYGHCYTSSLQGAQGYEQVWAVRPSIPG